MSNLLPRAKQLQILRSLVEGCSIRSTERMVDVSRETVFRCSFASGKAARRFST